MPPKPEQTEQQPGADRFWGQFSESKAGRTRSGAESDREPRATERRDDDPGHGQCLEWCPICRSAELFRSTVSPELRQQAEAIQHEAIGVLRAFLDAYAEKSAAQPPSAATPSQDPGPEEEEAAPRVTDIPLD